MSKIMFEISLSIHALITSHVFMQNPTGQYFALNSMYSKFSHNHNVKPATTAPLGEGNVILKEGSPWQHILMMLPWLTLETTRFQMGRHESSLQLPSFHL